MLFSLKGLHWVKLYVLPSEEAQVYDGIQEIQKDGTAVLTDKSANIFRELLGYDGRMIKVSDMEAKSQQLGRKFKEWAKKVY
jgi:hypothetical protein